MFPIMSNIQHFKDAELNYIFNQASFFLILITEARGNPQSILKTPAPTQGQAVKYLQK